MQESPSVPWVLAMDTGTSDIVVAAGTFDGRVLGTLREAAGFRHGELLLMMVERLIAETGLDRADLRGIVVGTGPGAFTGLRVGLATAKTLAHALGIPLAGVSTAGALIRAAVNAIGPHPLLESSVVLLLPAGPRDRVIVRDGESPRIVLDAAEPDSVDPSALIAVDLEGRAPEAAVARGMSAHRALGAALIELGAERLRRGSHDDPDRLVPDYVTLPRGIRATSGTIEWSNDPR